MTAIERKKFFSFFRYVVYAILFLTLYVLQNTPSLFSVYGVKPILLIPAAVVFAMYEGEFVGGVFGALAGMLCDLGGFFLFGFDAILTLVFSAVSGLLTIYLLRRNLRNAFMMVFVSMLILCCLTYFFMYHIWQYEDVASIFWDSTLWVILYSTLLTPVYFWMWRKLCGFFHKRME